MLQNRSPYPSCRSALCLSQRYPTSHIISSASPGYKPVVPSVSKRSGSDDKQGGGSSKVSSIDPFSLTAPTGLNDPDDSSPSSSDDSGGRVEVQVEVARIRGRSSSQLMAAMVAVVVDLLGLDQMFWVYGMDPRMDLSPLQCQCDSATQLAGTSPGTADLS